MVGDMLRILEKATQNKPSERYQDVDEFWVDLGNTLCVNTSMEPNLHHFDGIFPRTNRRLISPQGIHRLPLFARGSILQKICI